MPLLVLAWLMAPFASAQSGLHLVRLADRVELSWPRGDSNLLYTVQSASSLGGGRWQPAADTDWPLSTNRWSVALTAPDAGATRYFRLHAQPMFQRGRLTTNQQLKSYSPFDLVPILFALGSSTVPSTGVVVHRLQYETIDARGERTLASGAVALPAGKTGPFPVVCYQHATTTLRDDVPSQLNEETTIGLVLAASGYAVLMADYVGLGDSPGPHPYHHARSEATAAVDMLRAGRQFAALQGLTFSPKLFICGYSQGGHGALALLRELEAYHTAEFPVTAAAGGAGAYDLSGSVIGDLLSDRRPPNPYYFAYLIMAYQNVYGLTPSWDGLLAPQYRDVLPSKFDGTQLGSTISALLPARPVEILAPAFLADLRTNLDNPLRVACLDNDLWRWRPRAPLRLYHCRADEDVPYRNSEVALAGFRDRGASQVELRDPFQFGDHRACVPFALLAIKSWFDSLR